MPRAKVLAHFLKERGKELTARDIERATDLRQPEVSLALSAFIERKWIVDQKPKEVDKGRPSKQYILAIPAETLFQSIEGTIVKEAKEKQELLAELKRAMMVVKTVQPETPHVSGKQLSLVE